jgi:MFS family permease
VGDSASSSGVVLTPMMLGFMVSSIAGGQILGRTGRYKIPALGGFAVSTVGMLVLSRMDASATDPVVVRNMLLTGLGIGVLLSLFTNAVQNAFPAERLGQVTASLQFFRFIGGTIGRAIFGTVLSNRFASALALNLPDTLTRAVPPEQLQALQDPQLLLAPRATAHLQQTFAAMGPPGQALFEQGMQAIRLSLATAITSVFLLGALAMALGFVVTLFLPEIPLRRPDHPITPAGKQPWLSWPTRAWRWAIRRA